MNFFQKQWDKLIEKFADEDMWSTIGAGFIKVILIIIVSVILIRIGKSFIRHLFKIGTKSPLRMEERRENTLVKLLENVLSYVVYFVALMMILGVFGIKIEALLAGAGIVGLAVGFGAQNLVKDIITGFFIIFEDQFSVGDFIRTGNFEGTVEQIGLRTTKIRSWTGEMHILPNSSIVEVTNFSLNNAVAFVDVSIAYEEDISRAEQVIQELLEELPEKYPEMVKTPELLGIQMLGASEVMMRVTSEVTPMSHWKIARVLRREIKARLDEQGIEIPYPKMVLYNKEETNGQIDQSLPRGREGAQQ